MSTSPIASSGEDPGGNPAVQPLSARDKEMLLFEHHTWKFSGAKETAIRDKWDLNAYRYYQELNRILDLQAALAWDPVTVKRLRRLRAQRQRTRSARAAATET